MEEIKPQINQIPPNEVLLRNGTEWMHFADPHRIITAETLDDVLPALVKLEELIHKNHWYAAGFLSYEAAPAFDAIFLTHASSAGHAAPAFPYLWFGLYSTPRSVVLPKPEYEPENLNWQPTIDCQTYHAGIAAIKEHIAAGSTYQVNYTMRLHSDFHGEPWQYFLQLAQNQNRHAAYVDTGRYAICSASPEVFFQLDGNVITCRPMKGTTTRGRTTAEDRERADWLRTDPKNRAENVMIVDMIRNDLGRIAEIGSVSVPELFATERYPTLWQMTSTVTARTSAPLTQIFRALFPCASITGAPKVSTMKIIAALENTPRQIYTGTIGYISPDRKAKFNVAIRTLLVDRSNRKAEYGIGGGIVWDSDTTEEYAEALLKARVLTEPPLSFSLLETLLWTREQGFFLKHKHMARMLDSADYFDIPLTKTNLENFLARIAAGFRAPQRVRILLSQDGKLDAESSPFDLQENEPALKACLAKRPVNSSDVFLFHKTTRREVYESARKDARNFEDVLLYNEKGELTEFTIGNLVVELDGALLTPPISCGVLAGTFRAHLLETSQIKEEFVPIERLRDCSRIFRVNSIRRWQAVEIDFERRLIDS